MEFSHPIVRTAVYSGLSAAERARAHASAARLLAGQNTESGRVAAQLLATEAGTDAWAVETLRSAAREAASRGAPEVAATYLRRALLEDLDDQTRSDVLLEPGLAEGEAEPPPAGGGP